MNFNVPQLLIDIETLGSRDDAVIASFAATVFNFNEKDATYADILDRTFYVKLDIKDQISRFKRTTDSGTIDWWKKQPREVREMSIIPSADDVKVDEMLCMFRDFLEHNKFDYYNSYTWTRGIAYDIPKVEQLIKAVADAETPNLFNNNFDGYIKNKDKYLLNNFRARDVRTFNDVVGDVNDGKFELPTGRPAEFIEHHAKHDAALDVMRMLYLFNN